MKVLKPHWVSHDDKSIFSIDIHPDGSRFVTGGQGDDSGRVVIWNMAPVMSEAKEADATEPKMLCQLDNHLACVNCVRWSYSGKYLASGGDDKLVMVWTFAKSPSGGNPVFGGKGKMNVETWRCVSTLRGHQGDVLDMAWSPHDVWLATCSVDNTVIVWDAAKLPEIVAVLKGHSGLVKGVTWDPVGKYLSSQSDDRSLRIWRTVDWQQEAVIKKPFEDCGGTTLVLRLSWSPDGQYLVSAHAMNGSGPTAQIIEREGWKHDIDFVGHRKAVTCVRFSTNILKRYYSCRGKTLQACCCAIGSRDRAISVWVTALERPLFAMEGLFMRPVLDLSWSANGLQLMACSADGTVAYFEFTEKELGKSLSLDEKNALYEKIYGKSLVTNQPASAMAVENPEVIEEAEKEIQKEPIVVIVSNAKSVSKTPTSSAPAVVANTSYAKACTNKQIETRTSDGRRRITPIYIPPTPDTSDGPIPFGSESVPFSSSSECKSRIVIERRDVVVIPNVSPAKVMGNHLSTVSDTNVVSSLAKEGCAGTVEKSILVKRGSEKTERIPVKRPRFAESKALTETTAIVKCNSKDSSDTAIGITLPLPCLPCPATYMISGTHKQIVVENSTQNSPYGTLTYIKMLNNTELKWDLLIGSLVCCLALNENVIAVGCVDGTIHVLETKTGLHIVPALVLPKPAATVSVSKPAWVMCVTTSGYVTVWNMVTKSVVVSSESVAPVMTGPAGTDITINRCFVSDKGIPMLALSTGKAYMYSVELNSWMLALDMNDPVIRSSQKAYQSALHNVPENGSSPLKMLQTNVQTSSTHFESKRTISNFESSPLCTFTFLEHQLSACKALYSSDEYYFWLITTVRFLLQEGYEDRLRIICDELLGLHPLDSSEERKFSTSDSSVLGISKRKLLKDILAEIAATSNAQRLYLEYKEQLKYAFQ